MATASLQLLNWLVYWLVGLVDLVDGSFGPLFHFEALSEKLSQPQLLSL